MLRLCGGLTLVARVGARRRRRQAEPRRPRAVCRALRGGAPGVGGGSCRQPAAGARRRRLDDEWRRGACGMARGGHGGLRGAAVLPSPRGGAGVRAARSAARGGFVSPRGLRCARAVGARCVARCRRPPRGLRGVGVGSSGLWGHGARLACRTVSGPCRSSHRCGRRWASLRRQLGCRWRLSGARAARQGRAAVRWARCTRKVARGRCGVGSRRPAVRPPRGTAAVVRRGRRSG